MIEVNLSGLEEKGKMFLKNLTNDKTIEIRAEMIKFLKESYWPDCIEYNVVMEFLDDFFIANLNIESKVD
jgi:hypothetical protein